MKYPNLLWAIANDRKKQYELAQAIGCSESRLSKCLSARADFTATERAALARALGYSEGWLFQPVQPPTRAQSAILAHA